MTAAAPSPPRNICGGCTSIRALPGSGKGRVTAAVAMAFARPLLLAEGIESDREEVTERVITERVFNACDSGCQCPCLTPRHFPAPPPLFAFAADDQLGRLRLGSRGRPRWKTGPGDRAPPPPPPARRRPHQGKYKDCCYKRLHSACLQDFIRTRARCLRRVEGGREPRQPQPRREAEPMSECDGL